MKRFFTIMILLFAVANGFGQVMQASIGAGSSAQRAIIYIKPTSAVNGTISTLQFSVAIDAAIAPVPEVNIIGTPAFGVTWHIDAPYTEGGFRIYDFTTAASPFVTIGAAVETAVMEIEFTGGPTTASNILLLTLPGGGITTGNTLFFCSGAASSVEGQLYYLRAGNTVINNNSYTGTLNSSATLGNIVLPVTWLSFDVVKRGNNGLLTWTVGNEDANHHYEVQRSSNGTNFTPIANVSRSITGNTDYRYTDSGIAGIAEKILYYRIKQVDIDGHTSYSAIRVLRQNVQESQVSVFPNPVKDGFYVSMPLVNPGNKVVQLKLFAASGQLIDAKEITAQQALNYYFDTGAKLLPGGNYNLQVIFNNTVITTKKLLIIR